jgi:3-oxoacyl-[acyl-carrier-protein] synthase III
MSLMGATVPFPATREERESCGDPRLSIEERYAAKEIYLQEVQQAAQVLVEEGYLLAADLDLVASLASQRYDLFVSKAKSLQTTGD